VEDDEPNELLDQSSDEEDGKDEEKKSGAALNIKNEAHGPVVYTGKVGMV
jgi:hypothetical protein